MFSRSLASLRSSRAAGCSARRAATQPTPSAEARRRARSPRPRRRRPRAPAAANENDVSRFPDEKKLENVAATIQRQTNVREIPGIGKVVATLAKGGTVTEIAQRSTFFLVVFDNPKDQKKLMGWISQDAFTAPGRRRRRRSLTCTAARDAALQRRSVLREDLRDRRRLPDGSGVQGRGEQVREREARRRRRPSAPLRSRSRRASRRRSPPVAPIAGRRSVAAGRAAVSRRSSPIRATSDVVGAVGGRCPAGFSLIVKDGQCHRNCKIIECRKDADARPARCAPTVCCAPAAISASEARDAAIASSARASRVRASFSRARSSSAAGSSRRRRGAGDDDEPPVRTRRRSPSPARARRTRRTSFATRPRRRSPMSRRPSARTASRRGRSRRAAPTSRRSRRARAVVKIAKFFSTGVLVIFDDPAHRDGSKLMGWIPAEALARAHRGRDHGGAGPHGAQGRRRRRDRRTRGPRSPTRAARPTQARPPMPADRCSRAARSRRSPTTGSARLDMILVTPLCRRTLRAMAIVRRAPFCKASGGRKTCAVPCSGHIGCTSRARA